MIMAAQRLGYSVLEKGMSSWQVEARLEITSSRRGQLERVNARAREEHPSPRHNARFYVLSLGCFAGRFS